MAIKIKCAVAFCDRKAVGDSKDDEALCGWHWRKSIGPIRRRYEAAWHEISKNECLGVETPEDAQRVTVAWRELLTHASEIGR